MKQLPCIKHYVLRQYFKTIKTMTNNLTDMIFDDNFYFDPVAPRQTCNKYEFMFLIWSMQLEDTCVKIQTFILLSNNEFNLTHLKI